uniref:Uncharacterized protein n=1 Tax=Picea glauca TaxID=3330 RepID=A0A101M272_PICGL|nr:hypothetical protein ABT39_MTgene2779 [Picea glauca]
MESFSNPMAFPSISYRLPNLTRDSQPNMKKPAEPVSHIAGLTLCIRYSWPIGYVYWTNLVSCITSQEVLVYHSSVLYMIFYNSYWPWSRCSCLFELACFAGWLPCPRKLEEVVAGN